MSPTPKITSLSKVNVVKTGSQAEKSARAERAQGLRRRPQAGASDFSSAAMNVSFSSGRPMVTRSHWGNP